MVISQSPIVKAHSCDSSIQRRHQKVIEETPSVALDASLRARICAAAVALGQELGYVGAGTVEFILDDRSKEFFFLEVNARVQVEHPITEMTTGVDIVALQFGVGNFSFFLSFYLH